MSLLRRRLSTNSPTCTTTTYSCSPFNAPPRRASHLLTLRVSIPEYNQYERTRWINQRAGVGRHDPERNLLPESHGNGVEWSVDKCRGPRGERLCTVRVFFYLLVVLFSLRVHLIQISLFSFTAYASLCATHLPRFPSFLRVRRLLCSFF